MIRSDFLGQSHISSRINMTLGNFISVKNPGRLGWGTESGFRKPVRDISIYTIYSWKAFTYLSETTIFKFFSSECFGKEKADVMNNVAGFPKIWSDYEKWTDYKLINSFSIPSLFLKWYTWRCLYQSRFFGLFF